MTSNSRNIVSIVSDVISEPGPPFMVSLPGLAFLFGSKLTPEL